MTVSGDLERGARPLGELLHGLMPLQEYAKLGIRGIALDSREVGSGFLFLACAGARHHGLDYVDEVVRRGAACILAEPDTHWGVDRIEALAQQLSQPILSLEGLKEYLSLIAGRFYREPSRDLEVIGVTGTNGKTSCTHFLARVLESEIQCGVIGTLGIGFPSQLESSTHTTPDAVRLQAGLARLKAMGAGAVAMEVSSHALDQGRIAAVAVDGAVLTNLTQDHLDYHGEMAAYAAAKRRLFQHPGLRYAVLNHDDRFGRELLPDLPVAVRPVLYGTGNVPKLPKSVERWIWASRVGTSPEGMSIEIQASEGEKAVIQTPLMGWFNVSNLLAVGAVLLVRGWSLERMAIALGKLRTPPGRLESFGGQGQTRVIVDYAHTPDALDQVLMALRAHCQGRLICVFGCGGDRDRGKRPLMGGIVARHADQIILTDDNPRSENGNDIIADILKGIDPATIHVDVERDRSQAIRSAIGNAGKEDLVLIAGKGHETSQCLGDLVIPFSDREQVQVALSTLSVEVRA